MITYELEIDENGKFTLPDELRDSLGLQTGDSIRLVQTDDYLFMIPRRLLVPAFADYMSKLMAEKDITVSDLLESGEEIREQLFRERYGELIRELPR